MRGCFFLALFAAATVSWAQSPGEIERIVSHGPWPPPRARDAGNPVSGKLEAVTLGERLFYEPRLSGTGSVLCATCHVPYRGWQDGRATGFGLQAGDRNTPTLLNVAFQKRFGWDGKHDSLWSQSIRPLLDAREMRSSAKVVGAFVRSHFLSGYQRAFGHAPPDDDEALLADVGRALAAFQETLVTGRTPFDDYRDSLLEKNFPAPYSDSAKRGLKTFVGTCDACHAGPLFSSGEIVGGFRVPGLRNVAKTAPYMHDGRLATLDDVVRQHPGRRSLSDDEVRDLVAFLQSLSEKPTAGGQ